MKTRRLAIIVTVVLAMTLLFAMPVFARQENPRVPPPSQDPPIQPSPSVQDQPTPSRPPIQPPSDVGVPGDPTRADSGTSWGIPLLTLLVGFATGYFVGNSRPTTPAETRRDRVA